MDNSAPSPAISRARLAEGALAPARRRRGWRQRVASLSDHRRGSWLLAAVAFADSSFLPVPPDLLLIPMCLMRPDRMRLLMVVCVAASSLGAVFGYLLGYGLWNVVGARLVEFYGYTNGFASYQHLVDRWGATIIIAKAFTPIPFKIAAIAAGVAAMNPWTFLAATVVGRALHFAMVYALLRMFGARISIFVARYERPLAIVSMLALILLALVCYLK
jgi:membrane protein YqaA with SNARE-associated domain